ncbi:MAG: hypothetical protein JRF33_03860 [Deltaproteobacteria bacterium]|nr:hypothetical protein [Deltaproteobacteria bacterium]
MTRTRSQKTWLALGLVAVLMMTGSVVWAGDAVKLRFKFKPGDKQVYRMTMGQKMEVETDMAPGMTQKVNITINTDMYQKVLKQDGTGAVLEVGYTRMDANMSVSGQPMPIPGADELTKVRMTMKMSELGELGEAKVVSEKGLGNKALKMADEMKKSIAQGAMIFPEKALKPGDSWSHKQKVPTKLAGTKDMNMDVVSVYTFVGMDKFKGKPAAKVTAKVKILLTGKAVQNNIPMDTNLSGRGSSVSFFSVEDGRTLKTKTNMDIQGTVIASAQGKKFNTKLKIKTKVEMTLK